MPTRIVIADDHESVRQGLRWMLRADDAIEVVGEAADGEELLRVLETTPCDAVLLDLSMPVMDGLGVLAALRRLGRAIPVVVLSMHDDGAHVDRAIALGASGYILKSAPREEMIRAIVAATSGGAYVQPALAKPLLERHVVDVADATEQATLTPRQLQLLRALASGRTNRQVAHDLGISEATVKGYLKDLYDRLGVESRAGAVAYGLRHGLIR